MRPVRSGGIKGPVVITRTNEEANEEVRVYREGRLGLAFRSPASRLKPAFQSAVAVKPGMRSEEDR
jgi:hypothetical protein